MWIISVGHPSAVIFRCIHSYIGIRTGWQNIDVVNWGIIYMSRARPPLVVVVKPADLLCIHNTYSPTCQYIYDAYQKY